MRKTILSLILLSGLAGSALAAVSDRDLQKDAPDRYTVTKGDTLWAISKRYLKDPWKWPDLWGMNREQIKNPHLIYPGQVLVLERRPDGTAQIKATGLQTVKLEPRARVEPSAREALATVPRAVIEPFLSKPLVIEAGGLDNAPIIAGGTDGRVVFGSGDTVYAIGMPAQPAQSWNVYRPGKALVDPDTREILGYEAVYLGDAKLLRQDEVSKLQISYAALEINKADRLTPSPGMLIVSYNPRAPEKPVSGRILAAYGGLAEAGQNAIVTLSRGARDGIERGHVLAVYEDARISRVQGRDVKLPGERLGLLVVFHTFDRVSYALVVESHRPMHVGDWIAKP
ncbi:MAG TPA: LysM peptidoglycan-binding domain-containing protein [Burkholderiales bacterium]